MQPFEVTDGPDDTTHVVLHGDIDYQVSRVDGRLLDLGIEPGRDVTVDLAEVPFIDSSGLGLLLGLRNNAASFRVVNTRHPIARIFAITGVEDLLGVDPAERAR